MGIYSSIILLARCVNPSIKISIWSMIFSFYLYYIFTVSLIDLSVNSFKRFFKNISIIKGATIIAPNVIITPPFPQ